MNQQSSVTPDPLDPEGSDFVLRAAFAPVLYQLLQSSADRSRDRRTFLVGDVPPVASVEEGERATLIAPDGRSADLAVRRDPFVEPGVYRLRQGRSTTRQHVMQLLRRQRITHR